MVTWLKELLGVLTEVAKAFTEYGSTFGLVLALTALVLQRRAHDKDRQSWRADLKASEEGRRADIVAELRDSRGRAETLAPLSHNLLAAIGHYNGLAANLSGVGEGPIERGRARAPRKPRPALPSARGADPDSGEEQGEG